MTQPLYFEDMTPLEVSNYIIEKPAILLPLGVTEPHGNHLPVGTDNMCAVGLCETLSRELEFAIAPPVLYGLLDRMVGHPGAITLSQATYTALIEEIFEQFARAGVRFFVICNGHGPNLGPIVEAIKRVVERHSVQFLVVEWWTVAAGHIEGLFNTSDLGHGGIGEVAAILHYRPELVNFKQITPDAFCKEPPGVFAFPLQKTAVAENAPWMLDPDKDKMRELMAVTEEQVVASVRSAYEVFRQNR